MLIFGGKPNGHSNFRGFTRIFSDKSYNDGSKKNKVNGGWKNDNTL